MRPDSTARYLRARQHSVTENALCLRLLGFRAAKQAERRLIRARKRFTSFDKDKSGTLEGEELKNLAVWCATVISLLPAAAWICCTCSPGWGSDTTIRAHRVFSSFRVGSGTPSTMDDTELQAATDKLLADADTDRDGKVSFEEFGACVPLVCGLACGKLIIPFPT